jgi:divalent metal cation (Fe/Co/Zn/Cd) transporter
VISQHLRAAHTPEVSSDDPLFPLRAQYRPLKVLVTAEAPDHLRTAAVGWCSLSVLWSAVAGVSAAVVGLDVSSAALLGFGANSILDGAASAVLIWRFGAGRSRAADADAVERRAALAVSVVMIGVALYVAATAINALATQSAPAKSLVGVILAAASTFVLPVLARAKLGLAKQLPSSALRGDGVLSLAGAVLAAATLASLIVHVAFGWWWADAVAALLIAAVLLGEGARTIPRR